MAAQGQLLLPPLCPAGAEASGTFGKSGRAPPTANRLSSHTLFPHNRFLKSWLLRQEQKIHQTGSTVQVRPRRGGAESQEEPQAWRGRKEVGRGRDHKASDRGRKRGIRPEGPCSAQSRQGEKISVGSHSDK